tara:strand:+ start:1017 stop:1979 length:963 start_codon:yes stop_codon:yes gene_type:complete
MISIIAGGAGFIGLNLSKKLLKMGNKVIILDNFSNSDKGSLDRIQNENFEVIVCDLSIFDQTYSIFKSINNQFIDNVEIWHLAANSDIVSGVNDIDIDYRDTFMSTYNLLKISKEFNIDSFLFASSSAVYGNHGDKNIIENTGPLMPISNYGAMKLASEAICFSALESFLKFLRIFRFPNVVGIPATHGVIKDLITKLIKNPYELDVLGNGSQSKSYLHVDDLIDGMIHLSNENATLKDPIFNLGNNNDYVTVRWIAEEIVKIVSPNAKIKFGKEDKGWLGDVPKFKYNTDKAKAAGWEPKMNSKESVKKAILEVFDQLK